MPGPRRSRVVYSVVLLPAFLAVLACSQAGPVHLGEVRFPLSLTSKVPDGELVVHIPPPNRRLVVVELIPNRDEIRFETNAIRVDDPVEQLSSTPFAVAVSDDQLDYLDLFKLRGTFEATTSSGARVRIDNSVPLRGPEVSVYGRAKLRLAFRISKDAKEFFIELPEVKRRSIALPME